MLKSTRNAKLATDLAREPIKGDSNTVVWMAVSFGVALALTIAVLALSGTGADGIKDGLRITGRWSFLLFWLAYAGGAIAALFGSAASRLGRRGRDFGLAYASAQSVHLGLVFWLFIVTLRPPLTGMPLVLFSVAMILTYTLAVFSVGGLSKVLGSRGWRALRVVGLNCILFAFGLDFVRPAWPSSSHYEMRTLVQYTPFAVMCLAAPVLVAAAAAQRRLARRHNSPALGRPSIDIARL